MSYNVAGIAGPALAAVLAGVTSPGAATVVLGAGALAGAALLAGLPLAGSGTRSPALAGVVAVVRQPVLATLTLSTSLGALAGGMLPVIVAVAATRAGSPAAAGLLLAATAVGALAGSALWTRWPAPAERAPWWVAGTLAATGLPVLAGAAHPTLPVLAVAFTVAGIADGPLFGALLTTRQRWSPPELRSQVFTLGAGAKITAAAAGAALAGTLAGTATGAQLAVAGTIPLVAAGLAAAGFTRAREPLVTA
jgi:MFS family permease